MKALITGASSGMGWEFAKVLSKMGYDLIVAARREERLLALQRELGVKVQIICCDLSVEAECKKLFHCVEQEEIDILINNAGFGVFGEFSETELSREIDVINTNIKAVHILTKLFLEKFEKVNRGYILNVASAAGFFPGPLFASYYASKSYVLRLTQAIYEELRRKGSHVRVSVLCPGPVGTEFGDVANVKFAMGGGLESSYVAKYTIEKMLRGKLVIVPSIMMKTAVFLRHCLPDKVLARAVYHIQKSKCEH